MDRIIIGLTGAFGSGASFIADNFLVKGRGFKKFSLSKALKEKFKSENGRDSNKRSELQEFGNKVREKNINCLAEIIYKEISKNKKDNIVIDSIRNPAEVEYFRKNCKNFIL